MKVAFCPRTGQQAYDHQRYAGGINLGFLERPTLAGKALKETTTRQTCGWVQQSVPRLVLRALFWLQQMQSQVIAANKRLDSNRVVAVIKLDGGNAATGL